MPKFLIELKMIFFPSYSFVRLLLLQYYFSCFLEALLPTDYAFWPSPVAVTLLLYCSFSLPVFLASSENVKEKESERKKVKKRARKRQDFSFFSQLLKSDGWQLHFVQQQVSQSVSSVQFRCVAVLVEKLWTEWHLATYDTFTRYVQYNKK